MIKLIYDKCTPTAERRPTTAKDIEEDIHVETFNTEEELLDYVAKLLKYDEDDLADVDGETPLDKVEKLIEWCNDDPGDGTPNFLYLSKDGFEIPCCEPYLEIEWMDLEKATKEEIVKELQAELNDEEERINREKDDEAERKVIDKELEETPVEKVVAEINSKTLKDVFDYYINLFGQGRMVIRQQNYLRSKIATALQKLDNAEYTGKEIDHLLGYAGGPHKAIKFSYKSKDKNFTVICWEIERNWAKGFIDRWVDDPSLEDGAELDLTLPREYEMSHTKDGKTKYLFASAWADHLVDTTENHKEKKDESFDDIKEDDSDSLPTSVAINLSAYYMDDYDQSVELSDWIKQWLRDEYNHEPTYFDYEVEEDDYESTAYVTKIEWSTLNKLKEESENEESNEDSDLNNLDDYSDEDYEKLNKYALTKKCDDWEDVLNYLTLQETKEFIDRVFKCLFGNGYFNENETTYRLRLDHIEVFVNGEFDGNYYMQYDRSVQADRLYTWTGEEYEDDDLDDEVEGE